MRLLNFHWPKRGPQEPVPSFSSSPPPRVPHPVSCVQAPRESAFLNNEGVKGATRPRSLPTANPLDVPSHPKDRRRLVAFLGTWADWHSGVRKVKIDSEGTAPLKVPFRVVRCIDAAGGTLYTMTQSLMRGSYAKVRWGVDGDGVGVCIKEARLVDEASDTDMAHGPGDKLKTCAVRLSEAAVEVAATRHMRALIEASIVATTRANGDRDPLSMLRTQTTPFEVRRPFIAANKLYMVTSLASGDLCELHADLSRPLRRLLARSVAAQMADELSAVHQAGFVHLDIKNENIVFSQHGQVKLIDWMTSDTFEPSGLTTPTRGITGSHPTPDMVRMPSSRRSDGSLRPHKLKAGTDVWQLGVALLRLLVPTGTPSPFLWQAHTLRRVDVVTMREHLQDFERWRTSAFDAQGAFAPDALRADNPFASYVRVAWHVDPLLCDYILRHMLLAQSEAQVRFFSMAKDMREMVEAMPQAAFDPLIERVQQTHAALGQAQSLEHLRRCDALFGA